MSGKYLSSRQTTFTLGVPTFVTVTHPYHPLLGQKLELVRVMRRANSKLLVRHPDGRSFRMPIDWTDFKASQVQPPQAPVAQLLDISGLLRVAGIVGNIKTETPPPETGDGTET